MTTARHVPRVRSTGWLGGLLFILCATVVTGTFYLKEPFLIGVVLHEESNLPFLIKNISVSEIAVDEEEMSAPDGFNISSFYIYRHREYGLPSRWDSFGSVPYAWMIGVVRDFRSVFTDLCFSVASSQRSLRQSEIMKVAGNVSSFCDLWQRNPLLTEAEVLKMNIGTLNGFGGSQGSFVDQPLQKAHYDQSYRCTDEKASQYVEWISPFGRFCITMFLFALSFALPILGIRVDRNGNMTWGSYVIISIAVLLGLIGVFSVPGDWWNRLLN